GVGALVGSVVGVGVLVGLTVGGVTWAVAVAVAVGVVTGATMISPASVSLPAMIVTRCGPLSKFGDACRDASHGWPAPAGEIAHSATGPLNGGAKLVAKPEMRRVAPPAGRAPRTTTPPGTRVGSIATQHRNPASESKVIRTVLTLLGMAEPEPNCASRGFPADAALAPGVGVGSGQTAWKVRP